MSQVGGCCVGSEFQNSKYTPVFLLTLDSPAPDFPVLDQSAQAAGAGDSSSQSGGKGAGDLAQRGRLLSSVSHYHPQFAGDNQPFLLQIIFN